MSWEVIFIASFLILLVIRAPIAVALLGSSIIFLLGSGISLQVIPQIMAATFNSFVLLAIPLFMIAGELMNSGGVTTRLFTFAQSLVGHIPGSLSHVNVIASMIFAGMTGSAVADCAGLGVIEMKAMKDAGYDVEYSAAITAASSTIGPIIPPSITFVLYGSLTGTSVGALFVGGIIPGVMMGLSLLVAGYVISVKRGYPRSEKMSWPQRLKAFLVAFPAILTPVIILSGIMLGVFTPTEAAAVAVVYALALGMFFYREVSVPSFLRSLLNVAKSISTIMVIVSSAAVFGWILAYVGIPSRVAAALLEFSQNKYVILLLLNLFLLFVGCFMESIAIILILVPMLMPVLDGVGIDRTHFGVVMGINIAIGLITPPVGVCLYIVSNIGKVPFERVVKEITPMIIALVAALALITYFPSLVLWLPSILI